ncbi:hypothetical protein N8940_00520 [Sphingomonadaceae bacterium]|nr:hypothetical protein [Sphingomonadaceae bacterium]
MIVGAIAMARPVIDTKAAPVPSNIVTALEARETVRVLTAE